jgi:signal transduction histidine kinase
MPNWLGSIRVRLAVLYSSVLFVVTSVLVMVLYVALDHTLPNDDVYQRYRESTRIPGGTLIEERVVVDLVNFANAKALELLRTYSLWALLALFLISLVVGWFTAGRVLVPIEKITEVAKEIQATDLSRRIDLGGPQDELRDLADTFDDMLGRIDEAFESQKQFIHEASHELRNPLAVIQTNLDVSLADPGATAEDLRHTLEVIRRSSERMNRLVDDLLVYARKGSLSLVRESVDLSTLVHDLVAEFRVPADTAGVTLLESAEPGLWVDGDRDALRQALANLMANAIRLSPTGSTVRVRGGRHEAWVWMAVEDDGPGIAFEDQERVFQRFWRGEGGAGRSEGRSGLGLTIVRQIAEAHSGEVKLVSELGAGSAFAIWLPATQPVSPAPEPPRASDGAAAHGDATPDAAAIAR